MSSLRARVSLPLTLLFFLTLTALSLTSCGGSPSPAPQAAAAQTGANTGSGSSGSSNTGPTTFAYVFTVDSLKGRTSEFSLTTSGQLQQTSQLVPDNTLPAATSHGVVFVAAGQSSQTTVALQSYALGSNGSLQAQGAAVTYPQDKVSNLSSDSTYVYAVSDEGIFAFEDQSTGLTPLAATEQMVPSPCTPAQENLQYGCAYSASLLLSNGVAYLSERNIPSYGLDNTFPQLSAFERVQGALTNQQLISSYVGSYLMTVTPNGQHLYLLDWVSSRILRYDMGTTNTEVYSVLANGQQLQAPGTANLFVTPDGALLLAVLQNQANAGQVRVFQIDKSSANLTEVSGSPFSTGENYLINAALDPTGEYLLAVHSACSASADPTCSTPGKLVAMSIDHTTGAIAVASDVADGVQPGEITAALVSK